MTNVVHGRTFGKFRPRLIGLGVVLCDPDKDDWLFPHREDGQRALRASALASDYGVCHTPESGGVMGAPGKRSTKQRMLDSAVLLLRERGAAGVTVDAVLAHSGAPRGSVYHHFPGGRNEMVLGAVRLAGDYISGVVAESAAEGDVRVMLERLVAFWKRSLTKTDYRAGCPAAAMAMDSRDIVPEAADVVREIFVRWQDGIAEALAANGFAVVRAQRLATVVVSAVEGAIILCRAQRDLGPLDDVLAEIGPLLERRD
ncbi:TetR/AcrR family transcriptional regulator [Lentzea sp. NPDC058450]|uniref:TetR/AcrR family transcriptional regulator n=1 Tax=Lentzea sp. NPDC058450 TaxID=3346505 RepID=UPI003654299B